MSVSSPWLATPLATPLANPLLTSPLATPLSWELLTLSARSNRSFLWFSLEMLCSWQMSSYEGMKDSLSMDVSMRSILNQFRKKCKIVYLYMFFNSFYHVIWHYWIMLFMNMIKMVSDLKMDKKGNENKHCKNTHPTFFRYYSRQ